MPTRRYFKKAHSQDKIKGSGRPKHKGKMAIVTARGHAGVRVLPSATAALRMGQSNGGKAIRDSGQAHRWTSETARKAALKLWKTRFRALKRGNTDAPAIRIGLPAKRRARLDYKALRLTHSTQVVHGLFYDPTAQVPGWYQGSIGPGGSLEHIAERTALRRLGYLQYRRKTFIPDRIIGIKQVRS